MSRSSRLAAAAAGAGLALALAACGASGATGAGAPASSSPAAPAPVTPAAAPAASGNPAGYPVTDYLSYAGGTAGAADNSLSPVQIGWVNQQGGSADIAPEATQAAEMSVKYVNQHLGGIHGHPLKLVECGIPDTVAAAAQCGEQMADNSRIQVVAVGAVTVGNQSLEQAIAPTRKPIIFGVSGSEEDVSYRPGFLLYGDGLHLEGPLATFTAKNLHARKVSIVYENTPGQSVLAQIIASGLKIEGSTSKIVAFDPSTTNLTGPLIAAGSATSDATVALVEGDTCVNFDKALKQLDITRPVVTNVTCISSSIITGDGGVLPSWYYAVGSSLASDTSDPSGAAFAKVAAMYGDSKDVSDNWWTVTFSQILTIAKFLNQDGPGATAAQLTSAAQSFKGPLLWGPPDLTCGKYANAPSVCNDEVQFFYFTGKVFQRSQSWLGPPPGLTVPNA